MRPASAASEPDGRGEFFLYFSFFSFFESIFAKKMKNPIFSEFQFFSLFQKISKSSKLDRINPKLAQMAPRWSAIQAGTI